MRTATRIQIANDSMSINAACAEAGLDVADYGYGSIKSYCPFSFLHTDGGASKAFRVYSATNSAYCFAGCGRFTPVTMIATAKDMSSEDAADWILTKVGYVEENYQDQWDALVKDPPPPDRDSLTEALKLACARMDSRWEDRQFEDEVARRFVACLALLPKVNTAEDATTWLNVTKQAMSRVLGGVS